MIIASGKIADKVIEPGLCGVLWLVVHVCDDHQLGVIDSEFVQQSRHSANRTNLHNKHTFNLGNVNLLFPVFLDVLLSGCDAEDPQFAGGPRGPGAEDVRQ